jgi:hypothetical protein
MSTFAAMLQHTVKPREAWRELVGDMTPTVKTGGGGAHLCLRCPPEKTAIGAENCSEAIAR